MTRQRRERIQQSLTGLPERNELRARARAQHRHRFRILRAVRRGEVPDLASARAVLRALGLAARSRVRLSGFGTTTIETVGTTLIFGPDGRFIGCDWVVASARPRPAAEARQLDLYD